MSLSQQLSEKQNIIKFSGPGCYIDRLHEKSSKFTCDTVASLDNFTFLQSSYICEMATI